MWLAATHVATMFVKLMPEFSFQLNMIIEIKNPWTRGAAGANASSSGRVFFKAAILAPKQNRRGQGRYCDKLALGEKGSTPVNKEPKKGGILLNLDHKR